MRPDPLFDPAGDGQEPDGSLPPAGPDVGPEAPADTGPGPQGLYLCLPAAATMLSERDIELAHPEAFDFAFGNLPPAKRAVPWLAGWRAGPR